jgi:hypothetical protein
VVRSGYFNKQTWPVDDEMGTLWFSDKQERKFVYLEKLTFQMVKHQITSMNICKISFV